MATRRPHKKSRGGCSQCKIGRIKCDEKGPPCYACITRNQKCEYSHRAQLERRARGHVDRTSSSGPPTTLESALPYPNSLTTSTATSDDSRQHFGARERKVELELMNHWTARTSLTFCHQMGQDYEAAEQRLWQQHLPKQALQRQFLLDAMFALTSLHIASESDSLTKDNYLRIAIEYQSSSLQTFLRELPNVTAANCQEMYVGSLAFFILGIAMSHMGPTQQVEGRSVLDSVFEVLALYSGSKRIMTMFQSELNSGPLAIILAPKDMCRYPQQDPDFEDAIDVMKQCIKHRLTTTVDKDRYFHSLAHALEELRDCSRRLVSGTHAALIGWLINLDDEFVSTLREGDVLAKLILMHWAVLLDKLNELWWSFRAGRTLLEELSTTMPLLQESEVRAVRWCHSQVGLSSAQIAD